MDTPTLSPTPAAGHLGPLGVARLLVLFQGALLLASTIEATVVMSAMGPGTLPNVVLSGAAGLATLLAAAGLSRGSRWARRWTIVAELGVLALVVVDVVVGLVLGGPDLTPMTLVMRVAVPIAVVAILRRADVRVRFAPAARAADRAAAEATPTAVAAGAGATVGGAA